MAGKKELQKTISFRLNMTREDEREIYEAIASHNRGQANDSFGSSGAYIKAALASFLNKKKEINHYVEFQKEMEKSTQQLAELQCKLFLEALSEHDTRLVEIIMKAMTNTMQSPVTSGASVLMESADKNNKDKINANLMNKETESENEIPEEALLYLQNM